MLSESLKALQIQESLFRPALRKLTNDWVPTPKEEGIIQAAVCGLYRHGDIEGAFGEHGGFHGITALVLAFRYSDLILI